MSDFKVSFQKRSLDVDLGTSFKSIHSKYAGYGMPTPTDLDYTSTYIFYGFDSYNGAFQIRRRLRTTGVLLRAIISPAVTYEGSWLIREALNYEAF